jgi:hypothetical protein
MKKKMPPAAILRRIFRYDPETGLLWWREPNCGRSIHRPAGHIDENGYCTVYVIDTSYKAHRVIWKLVTGREPRNEIDHRDTKRANCSSPRSLL